MSSEQPHALRAFFLAPLLVPILWAPLLGLTWAAGPLRVLEEVGLVVLSSLPFIYAATILIGLPVYLLIRRRWQLKAWHPMVAGAVLGALILPMAERDIGRTVGIGGILGFAAGSLFWVLWRPSA
jgi:hypothetical protein